MTAHPDDERAKTTSAAPEPRVCLIGGSGRSGTTILKRILAAHPEVATLPTESRFLVDPDGIVDFHISMEAAWSPFGFDVRLRRLERLLRDLGRTRWVGGLVNSAQGGQAHDGGQSEPEAKHRPSALGRLFAQSELRAVVSSALPRYWSVDLERYCPGYRALVDELVERLSDSRFDGRWMGTPAFQRSTIVYGSPHVAEPLRWFCRSLFGRICEQQHATHFVEDTPFNLVVFDRVLALLPDAKLIHIYRDPRDVVASYMGRRWSPSEPIAAARYYLAVMRRWDDIRSMLPAKTLMEVSLETLVREPEPVLGGLCDFLDLEWRPSMLNVDLSRSHAGRWRRDIPAAALPEVERLLAPYVKRYVA